MFVTGPESVEEGDGAEYVCEAGVSSPPPQIEWEVTNQDGEHVEDFDAKDLSTGILIL